MTEKSVPIEWQGRNASMFIEAEAPIREQNQAHVATHLGLILEEFAEAKNVHFHLHVCGGRTVYYPRDDVDTITVVLGGLPPGESGTLWAETVVGIRLDQDQRTQIKVPGYAKGYGKVVRDEDNCAVAQLVGSTIYLFLPTSAEKLYLLAGHEIDLFAKALQVALEALPSFQTAPHLPVLDGENVVARSKHISGFYNQRADKKISAVYERINALKKEMNELFTSLRLLQSRRASFPEVYTPNDDDVMAEWTKLEQHPLFDYAEWSLDNCLHIHTKDVLMDSGNGEMRNVGRFVIRVAVFEGVWVWSKYLTHPKRIPHPHIGQSGSVCFGNITQEVERLIVYGTEAEISLLVLDWLGEGYDAGLADTKLEEWPLADVVDQGAFSDLSFAFAVTECDPDGAEYGEERRRQ